MTRAVARRLDFIIPEHFGDLHRVEFFLPDLTPSKFFQVDAFVGHFSEQALVERQSLLLVLQ